MRPTGLASPVDQHRQDFIIYSGACAMGQHLQAARRLGAHALVLDAVRVVGKPPKVHTNDHAPTLEAAKAACERHASRAQVP
jgi:hypothetical protein